MLNQTLFNISNMTIAIDEISRSNIVIRTVINQLKRFYKRILIVSVICSIIVILLIHFKKKILNNSIIKKMNIKEDDIDLTNHFIISLILLLNITGLTLEVEVA